MNEHAGASCALSVLIVAIFAILLHNKDHAPPRSQPTPIPVSHQRVPEPAASEVGTRIETAFSAAPPVIGAHPNPVLATVPDRSPAVQIQVASSTSKPLIEQPSSPTVRRSKVRPKPKQPRSGFTVVEAGETLADLADRVYGSSTSVESIWKANRDQLARPDVALIPGTLLRTP